MANSPSRSSNEHSIRDSVPESTPLDILRGESEQINPAILLAEKLMRRDLDCLLSVEEIEEAEAILAIGSQEIETVESHRKAFLKTPASAINYVPIGF